jgi:peptide methionine sulfoxide reductase MsrB
MQPKFHGAGSSQVIETGCSFPVFLKAEQHERIFRPSSQSWQARATERVAARHLAHLSRGSTLEEEESKATCNKHYVTSANSFMV